MILVTGGTGFLGRHLVPALCRAGHSVRVLARQPDAHPWLRRYPRVQVVAGDVLDANAVLRAADDCIYIIHAAGKFRFWGDETDFERTNVGGTENVIRAALTTRAERVLHISTIAVIGQPEPHRLVDEDHPPRPADAYQRSKLKAEQALMRAFAEDGLPAIILRPGAFYGPLGHYAFNRLFFTDPMRGLIMQIDGGRYIIFPAYIGDVAQGVLKTFERGRVGEIYNICGASLTHREAFDIICEEADLNWPRLTIPGWLGIGVSRVMSAASIFTRTEPFWPLTLRSYVYNYWRVSNEKARRELNFVPTSFREGARRTIAWYRAGCPDHVSEVEC